MNTIYGIVYKDDKYRIVSNTTNFYYEFSDEDAAKEVLNRLNNLNNLNTTNNAQLSEAFAVFNASDNYGLSSESNLRFILEQCGSNFTILDQRDKIQIASIYAREEALKIVAMLNYIWSYIPNITWGSTDA